MIELDSVWHPETQQATFRQMLEAYAHPGNGYPIHQQPASVLSLLATLLDGAVSLADPHQLLSASDWPMLQVQRRAVEEADYIVCRGDALPTFSPKLGSLENPEHSATLIVVVEDLRQGELRLRVQGPGVKSRNEITLNGLHIEWLAQRQQWVGEFPLGVDLLLFDGLRVAALPRTSKVEVV